MRTKIAKKAPKHSSYKRTAPLSEALISELCQHVKHRRKKRGIEKRLLKADRSFIRSSYKWTRLYYQTRQPDEMTRRKEKQQHRIFRSNHKYKKNVDICDSFAHTLFFSAGKICVICFARECTSVSLCVLRSILMKNR